MKENLTPRTEFEERVEAWKNMDRSTDDSRKEASKFYDQSIFPLVKEMFINDPKKRPQRQYDALVLTVGFSPEPLILSIIATQPEKVGLLHTPETRKFLDRIQRETNLTLDRLHTREIDGSNVIGMYRAIMELYAQWDKPASIAVDITGGKKSMVSGAAMAGAVLGADICYIDNEGFDRELGKPEPGSEYLSLLDNPYTVFGDLEVNKATELYNGHDYVGAQRIFNQLEKQVRDANLMTVYEAYGLLCETYESWDNLDIGNAIESLDRLLKILEQLSSVKRLEPLRNSMPIFYQHKAALNSLQAIFDKEERALQIPDGFHFAFMLYYNALRRESQGKLDMACLALYRLLEWIEQHRLAQYRIITSQPEYSNAKIGIDETALLERYNQKRKAIGQGASVPNLPDPIALVDGFLLLAALEDEITKDINLRALHGQVSIRNKSVYAHGMSKINPTSFESFKSTVKKRFEQAQSIAEINPNIFNKQHKFITPLP